MESITHNGPWSYLALKRLVPHDQTSININEQYTLYLYDDHVAIRQIERAFSPRLVYTRTGVIRVITDPIMLTRCSPFTVIATLDRRFYAFHPDHAAGILLNGISYWYEGRWFSSRRLADAFQDGIIYDGAFSQVDVSSYESPDVAAAFVQGLKTQIKRRNLPSHILKIREK